ncbi:MAG: class I SAM-dependent methyltransferase [Elusimicrobiales bacterium]|nr:class I SAM-dependent methyltransferase [Elusimicrobiales bacterium]
MKLNIGCGRNYLKCYINIDSSGESLADKIMQAHCLDIKSEAADEVKALHLIEHLGFFKSKYFLSEVYRVLKPNGVFIMETPYIEKSFENFLKGNRSERESVLGWIYGSETEGMRHVYCFPIELIKEITAEAGFEIIKTEEFNYHPNRPALRFTMKRVSGLDSKNFMAEFRRELIKKNIIVFKDECIMSENENSLKAIEKHIVNSDYDMILKLSINNPVLINEFFKFAVKGNKNLKRFNEDNFEKALLKLKKQETV